MCRLFFLRSGSHAREGVGDVLPGGGTADGKAPRIGGGDGVEAAEDGDAVGRLVLRRTAAPCLGRKRDHGGAMVHLREEASRDNSKVSRRGEGRENGAGGYS